MLFEDCKIRIRGSVDTIGISGLPLLATSKSILGPELSSYVFEGSHRVIGLLVQALSGRPASADIGVCKKAARQLHTLGVLHRDLVRYNILITGEGPKFVDREFIYPIKS
ncbi:hypothetical protein PV04_10971 [Phialophora macrospora]|uniref:Protein kinase domain-containing protein n=1 Tax=Phialophora macrospora TaxID=1851006 RepID=A0A0D2CCP4_9EURO|nr:hypothetical protein PV04_10971 [Phialophora macrospora]